MNLSNSFFKGLEYSFFLDQLIFLLLTLSLFSLYSMKDWTKAMNVFFVFFVSYLAVLGLTILEIIYVDASIVKIVVYSFVFIVACFNLFTGSVNTNSRRKNKEKYRKPLAGISGVLCSFFAQDVLLGRKVIADFSALPANLVINIGIMIGLLLLLIIVMMFGSIFTITLGLKKKEWVLLCTGAAVGITIVAMCSF